MMGDSEKEEANNLQIEFEWILHEEVHAILKQLHTILIECARRFPVPLCGNDTAQKQERFVMSAAHHTTSEQVKCMLTLTGDCITQADINLRVHKQQNILYHSTIQGENPWKLQQIQDAGNHLQLAILHIQNVDKDYIFRASEEVLSILGNILGCLQRGRACLIVPRKKTIDDLLSSRNMKCLTPALPGDVAISFYIQSHKLVFAIYQLSQVHGTMKFETYQAECPVPWLNEVLVLFTVALQLCQQLKDKILVFSQYKDFAVDSRSTSAMSW